MKYDGFTECNSLKCVKMVAEAVTMKYAIVLAAGKGTRMKSNRNKVMHEILHKPMIGHLVDHLEAVNTDKIVVVTGHQNEQVESYLGDRVEYAFQSEQIGTGDAVLQAQQLHGKEGSTLLVFGDCALIQPETLNHIYEQHEGHDLTVISAQLQNPGTYRRIVRDNQGHIDRIIDYRNLTESEVSITEISLGIYCVNNELLFKYLPEIRDEEVTEEINLIRLVEILKKNGHSIQSLRVSDHQEFLGVNDRMQLNVSNKWLQSRVNAKHLANGVTIMDPQSTYIGTDVKIAEDVTIYPNNYIYGNTTIGTGTTLLPNCWLEDAIVGENSTIDASRIINSEVKDFVTLGPSSHLRMNTVVGSHARVGNYVEFKNTQFGEHSNCAHLTYIGDAIIGNKVNIGCGVVTVNYDGKKKYKTEVRDGAFVGSNANLIAPITIGENAVVAAGSTVNGDVADGEMAIARPRQENKPGYGAKYKNKEGK